MCMKYDFYEGNTGKADNIFSAAQLFNRVLYNRSHPTAIDRSNPPKSYAKTIALLGAVSVGN